MDLTSGHPYWQLKDGIPFSYPSPDRNTHATIVVIGGGITGALCAWHLTQKGFDCIVVDKGLIGSGSTGACTGIMQYDIGLPLQRIKHVVGDQQADRIQKLRNEAVTALQQIAFEIGYTDLQTRAGLYLASYKKDLIFFQQEYQARKAAGLDVDFIDQECLKNNFGISGEAGIYCAQGGQVNTFGFTHALLQHGMKKGLRVFERTAVTVESDSDGRFHLTTGDGISIEAGQVVCTAASELCRFIKEKLVDDWSAYMLMSRPVEKEDGLWPQNVTIWNNDNPHTYLRTTREGRMMVGGRDELFSTIKLRNQQLRRKKIQLHKDFKRIFPERVFEPEYCWSGTFAVAHDGLPFIGRYPPTRNLFLAFGFGANGIIFSQIAASFLKKWVKSKKDSDMEIFSINRNCHAVI